MTNQKLDLLQFATHPAAELLNDAVMRDRLPDHWAEMLGLGLRQVNESAEVG